MPPPLPHLCSVRAQECTSAEAVCADLFTLLSRIPPSGGNGFVIIMPCFTVRQGNSITGAQTGLAFVCLCVRSCFPLLSFPVGSHTLTHPSTTHPALPPPTATCPGAVIVSQLTAFLPEGTALRGDNSLGVVLDLQMV